MDNDLFDTLNLKEIISLLHEVCVNDCRKVIDNEQLVQLRNGSHLSKEFCQYDKLFYRINVSYKDFIQTYNIGRIANSDYYEIRGNKYYIEEGMLLYLFLIELLDNSVKLPNTQHCIIKFPAFFVKFC